MIPLDKFDSIEKMNIHEKIEKLQHSVIKEIEEEKNEPAALAVEPAKIEEKLSLFDLISKMQEKLINAPVSSSTSTAIAGQFAQSTTQKGTYLLNVYVSKKNVYTLNLM